ncbi:unnamed protein product [Prorocentrum cordatum]|uniref:Uncharacterized protein n=1 Tax=Prorocentrum cordatum TaxID=2364126 RepID=A0ABN9V5X0_9DINO|nr:unnamed protein product [Polarella glacialis]
MFHSCQLDLAVRAKEEYEDKEGGRRRRRRRCRVVATRGRPARPAGRHAAPPGARPPAAAPRAALCARGARRGRSSRRTACPTRQSRACITYARALTRLRGPSTDWVPSPGVLATPGPSPGEVQLPPGGGMRGGGAAPLASDAAAALPPPERRVLGLFPTTNARMVVGNMPINGVAERGLLAKGRVGAATAHHRQCCGLCRQQPPHGAGHAATARGQAPWRGTGCGNSSGQGSWPRCPYRHRGGRPPGV